MGISKTSRGTLLTTAALALILGAICCAAAMAEDGDPAPDPSTGLGFEARFAELALGCVGIEYPNKIAHVMQGDGDAKPPRDLTPAFFGCFDWHSAVHGHWLLARLARLHPEAPYAGPALEALTRSLTIKKMEGEAAYLAGTGRESFERPYGLAWLLQLAAELREWGTPEARRLDTALRPLVLATRERLTAWIPKLAYPIREGEHAQTAFAFGLMLDWAVAVRDEQFEHLLAAKVRELYLADRGCPMGWEPGGQDFLSPCLGEADLIRRILSPAAYAEWLDAFLPGIPTDRTPWLEPAIVTDRSDGKLAHLDGLNLSRAWMIEGMLAGLPGDDTRRASLAATAAAHRKAGLAAVTGEHYEGGHWLGSFATYLVTGRGLPSAATGDSRQPAF
jgi:hypothetical protein